MNEQKYNVTVMFSESQDLAKRVQVTLFEVDRSRLLNTKLNLGMILLAVEEAVAASAAGAA